MRKERYSDEFWLREMDRFIGLILRMNASYEKCVLSMPGVIDPEKRKIVEREEIRKYLETRVPMREPGEEG